MEESHSNNNTKSNNKVVAILLIVAILLLTVGIVYLFQQNQKLKKVEISQKNEISSTYLKLDSVSTELNQKIETIQKLGGDISELKELQKQLEQDKRNLIISGKRKNKSIAALNKRVNGYKELLIEKDKEIIALKKLNANLVDENKVLKVEKNELNKSIEQLEENKEELIGKVAIASQLKISGLTVNAVNSRGKERATEFRNKHIDHLKIAFKVEENKVAPVEGKMLMVRIVAPDGKEIFDVTKGSGSFNFQNREMFYTVKKEILYDKTSQSVSCTYKKGTEYAVGRHVVEVYTDDYLMGKGHFTVK